MVRSVTSSAGFLLNDEMDDLHHAAWGAQCSLRAGAIRSHAIAPGHRPLSSMTPTILLRDGKLSLVTGSPGGATIISATLLRLLNWIAPGMEPKAAINAPRFHHQWLPTAFLIERSFPESLESALNARGPRTYRVGHIGIVTPLPSSKLPATGWCSRSAPHGAARDTERISTRLCRNYFQLTFSYREKLTPESWSKSRPAG